MWPGINPHRAAHNILSVERPQHPHGSPRRLGSVCHPAHICAHFYFFIYEIRGVLSPPPTPRYGGGRLPWMEACVPMATRRWLFRSSGSRTLSIQRPHLEQLTGNGDWSPPVPIQHLEVSLRKIPVPP